MLEILKTKARIILGKQKAMGVIEVVLIILVLVGLALVFKSQISGIADGVYTTIKTQIKKVLKWGKNKLFKVINFTKSFMESKK